MLLARKGSSLHLINKLLLHSPSVCTVMSFSGMPRILLTVLTAFLQLFMSILLIISISLHTFLALVYIELLDGAGIFLPKQSLLMLLGPIGVCVRAT